MFFLFFFFCTSLIFTCPACIFLSGASALSAPSVLSKPWGILHVKGYGVVGVMCKPWPWGVESCPGENLLSVHIHPAPFRSLKSSASYGRRNWEAPGDGRCARKPSKWAAKCKKKPWGRREAWGHSHYVLSLKAPCFQMPGTRPSAASPHTCPALAASH